LFPLDAAQCSTVLSSESPQYSILKASLGSSGPFDSCEAMADMQKQIQELEGASSLRNKVKWLTLETKMAEQLNDLENCKKTFVLAFTGDTHSVVTDIKSILDDNKSLRSGRRFWPGSELQVPMQPQISTQLDKSMSRSRANGCLRMQLSGYGADKTDCSHSFVVIDAMDECFRQNDERDRFFVALTEIKSRANNVRVFISSRAEPDIESALNSLGAKEICMDQLEVDKDIRLHARSRLAEDKSLKKWNTRIKQEIEDKLVMKANGM
jgi:hypothetical protein